ncbi:hypothetical protein U27_03552 [Candidatus Vecturithrix granuli]|uniref:Polymerase nucleotidyl transferase domain-containing protein n=1 Tax=Vecturithrix granuli TaxID=1499967 RepID=A0A081BW85_VECG1|nr:hypothetical protein U27_03552 [Candidatus Vecturithrix granuli]
MKLEESLKQEILERLKPLQPEKVILFGSYAYGEPNKDSDVDVLVVTADDFIPQNFAQNMEIKLKVDRCLDGLRDRFPVDVIVHTKPMHARFVALQSAFAREILRKGIPLL